MNSVTEQENTTYIISLYAFNHFPLGLSRSSKRRMAREIDNTDNNDKKIIINSNKNNNSVVSFSHIQI